MESNHRTFRRADGILGVGFLVEYAGVPQAAIAWPDQEPQRYVVETLPWFKIEDVTELPVEQTANQDQVVDAAASESVDETLSAGDSSDAAPSKEVATIDSSAETAPVQTSTTVQTEQAPQPEASPSVASSVESASSDQTTVVVSDGTDTAIESEENIASDPQVPEPEATQTL